MITRLSSRRSAFALIEVLVAVLFIGIFMLALLQVRNQALYQFLQSGDQHTGAWLAEMKMAELVSENLPDPEDEETWVLSESGDFAEYDDRSNEINAAVNEEWGDRTHFADFEWECTKELIFVGPEFIGTQEDLEYWEQPLDENGDPTDEADPNEKPAARLVRITLIVYLPEPKIRARTDEDSEVEPDRGRPSIKLVTYVDPAILFNAEPDEEVTTPEG
ncbi:MAG: hypothetical protein KDB68_16850 [Planctomycetes bacterium]|nr:hypothetical protein [Planctomycetota bacterium]MCA8937857.1 hypothetical protein [Planctomycetota bacterium]MCA8946497.1 hypothetical protein [Planctomycetota bacterium]